MVLFVMFSYMFFISGIDNKTKVRSYYQNDSKVNYKINYVDSLSSSIKDIDIDYKYSSVFDENMNGYYKYNVLVYLYAYQDNVQDVVWFRKYDLVDDRVTNINNNDNVEIRGNFKLDFNKYHDELLKFINNYDSNIMGYINVKINITEYLDVDENINERTKNRAIDINIPVNDKSLIKVNNISSRDSYFKFDTHGVMNFILITLSLFCFSVSIALFALIIKQFRVINDRQNKYSNSLKKLLSKYEYCIVRVNKLYVSKKYNMIYVTNFDDLLDVYKTTNKVINFKEVRRGAESIFVIIDSNDAWIYRLTSNNVE